MKSHAIFSRTSGMQGMTGSLDRLVAWGEHLSVEQPTIDAQHEGIFKVAMEIAETWQARGNLGRLKAFAEKLAHLVEAHFRYEERQLEEVGYPQLDEHRAEHKVIADELQVIRDRLDRMGDDTAKTMPGFLVHNFVLGVTVGHIGSSDMHYCAYARKAAAGQSKVWPPGKCPFCGSPEVSTFECDVETWAASCSSCKAMGPFSASGEEAAEKWNTVHDRLVAAGSLG